MTKITWFVKNNDSFEEKKEHHAGTFNKQEDVVLNLQVWNNRWGVENEDDLKIPVLNFSFQDFEDSSLVSLCEVFADEGTASLPVLKKGNEGSVILPREIAGNANDGTESSNKQNYMNIQFVIRTKGTILKSDDIKRLSLEVKELD